MWKNVFLTLNLPQRNLHRIVHEDFFKWDSTVSDLAHTYISEVYNHKYVGGMVCHTIHGKVIVYHIPVLGNVRGSFILKLCE